MNIIAVGCDTWKHPDHVKEWIAALPSESVSYTFLGSTIGDIVHSEMQARQFSSRRYPKTTDSLAYMIKDASEVIPGRESGTILLAWHPFLPNSSWTLTAVGLAIARSIPVILIEHDDEVEGSVGRFISSNSVVPRDLISSYLVEVGD